MAAIDTLDIIKKSFLSLTRPNRVELVSPRFESLGFKFLNRFYALIVLYIKNPLTKRGNYIVQQSA